jgi:uncharacterized protein YprB with RNaseH-like and TPR domain
MGAKNIPGISAKRKAYFDRRLVEAKRGLDSDDSSFFAARFPKSEMWRLYDRFRDDCVFLDVETSGRYGDITVLGLYDGADVVTLVKGKGLDSHNIRRALSGCKMIVTFNGMSFDVPVINRCFSRIVPDIPHLDLRFPLRSLGFTGGLKQIEQDLGILRSDITSGLSGHDAVSLWNDYCSSGCRGSLDLLVEYNTADVVNLRPLAGFVFDKMRSRAEKYFA